MEENYTKPDLTKEVERLMDEEGFDFGEAVKEAMANGYAAGGITGNKTYHQVRDKFMPMDSESMGYAYGGGVGSMMQPRMNFAGGGGDFQPLGYDEDESITVEDFSESFSPPMYRPVRSVGGVKLKEMPAGVDQSGIIDSAPSITNRNLRTIEGSLIDGDDPNSRYAVQQDFKSDKPFDRDFSSFDEAKMGSPANNSLGYQDSIMSMVGNDPFAGMNALEKDIAKQAMNTSQAEFDGDFNSEFYNDDGIYTKQKGEPIFAENRGNILKNLINKDTNMFGYQKKPTGILTNLKNDIGSLFSSAKEGIVNTGQRFKEGASKVPSLFIQAANYRNPLNPKASNYNRNLAEQLNALDGTTGTVTSGSTTFMSPEQIAAGNFGTKSGAMLVKDPNTGLDKYGPGSVLSGQNAISGFGTNDYLGQIDKYIDKMKQRKMRKDLSAFQNKKLQDAINERKREIDRVTAETAARESATADRARAANASVYASADRQGFTDGRGGGFGSRSTGTNDAFSNNSGRGRTGYQDGGIVSLRG